jgi:hypothetical protein
MNETRLGAKKRLKIAGITGAAAAAVVFSAAPALANHVSYTSAGARAVTSNSDLTLGIADEKGDSSPVYANFTQSGVSGTKRLDNTGGVNTTLYKNYTATILSVKACVNYAAAPDTCGPWG